MNVRHRFLPWFALAGALIPVWMLGGSLLLGLSRPGYEPLRDAISELGERGASTAPFWNIGGFGIVALLYAVYALAMRAGFGIGLLSGLTAMQAVFIAASAGFDCDPGCPPVPVTATMTGHIIVGLAYFAIATVLPLVAWRAFRRRPEWISLARPSLAVGLVLLALFFVGPTLGENRVGIWQRTSLLVAYVWQVVVALRLYALLRGPVAEPRRESEHVPVRESPGSA